MTHKNPILAAAFLGLASALIHADEHPDTDGWKRLFSPDQSNSVDPGKWSVTDGVLVAGNHRTLWTKNSYSDFVLDLEFKVEKESNSGVFLRSSDIKNVLKALEIQVHESKDYARKGPIGLQGLHGKAQAPVYYRNIRIKPLN